MTEKSPNSGRFTRLPVTIDAYRLPDAGENVPDSFREWCERVGFTDFTSERDEALIICPRIGNDMVVYPGDWIIKGVDGEFYPCRPDVFAATYVLEGSAQAAQSDFPAGAIHNGRVHAARLELSGLTCEAGDLRMCTSWQEFRRCFEHLVEWVQVHDAQAAQAVPEVWRPMETAPKDGTLLRLLVEFEDHATEDGEGPQPTIGSNTWDNHHDFDEWQFAGWDWEQDCYTQGVGRPVGWLPILAAPSAPAPATHSLVSDAQYLDLFEQARAGSVKPAGILRGIKACIASYEAATPSAPAAPAAPAVKWPNGCDKTVPAALRYLADHERPSGGEDRFNSAHLFQLADEIERAAKQTQAAPQPAAPQGKPPLAGRWHHGNGVVVSGGTRIASWDCDTNPPDSFRDKVLTWICDTLNAALVPQATFKQGYAFARQRNEVDSRNAARYMQLRRGQHWSVIDGIGNTLRDEALDAAIDAEESGS